MKTNLLICLTFLISTQVFAKERLVKGKISHEGYPLENVNIQIINSDVFALSDADGKYEITANEGDVLFFSAPGMESVNIIVEDVTVVLNVEMFARVEELENVTVTSKKYSRSQKELERNHWRDPNIIKTAFGFLDKNQTAYSIRTFEGDKMLPGEYNLVNVLRRRFAGLRINGPTANLGTSATSRNSSSDITVSSRLGNVLFDIDGQIFTDFPDFIDVQNIQRIAFIASLSGVTRYGNLARGGVIIINTKTGTFIPKDGKGFVVDQARLNNNFIKTSATPIETIGGEPSYLREWKKIKDFEEVKLKFEEDLIRYTGSPYFLLDAYQHFYDDRKQTAYADAILKSNYGKIANNPVLLKALAYVYESQGKFAEANEIFTRIFILRPKYKQSYLDLIRSNQNLNKNNRAASLLSRYFYLVEENFFKRDSGMFASIITREYQNLLDSENEGGSTMHRTTLEADQSDFKGTRLVFEWNDSEAEFNLQFVNPNNQFYTWEHSLKDSPELIQLEKSLGYSCSEYLIDNFFSGIWKVNIDYFGNKSLTPTYLKTTIYHNYGSPNQTREIRVFKLDVKNINRELFSINKNSLEISKKL